MVGMVEGQQLVRMGWKSIHTVGASACVIFILLQKIQKMSNKDMTFGYQPWAPPHAYTNRRWKNPARMQDNLVLRHRVMLMMTQGLKDCRKAGDFGSVPGMSTH